MRFGKKYGQPRCGCTRHKQHGRQFFFKTNHVSGDCIETSVRKLLTGYVFVFIADSWFNRGITGCLFLQGKKDPGPLSGMLCL